jgi:hypothetical protein
MNLNPGILKFFHTVENSFPHCGNPGGTGVCRLHGDPTPSSGGPNFNIQFPQFLSAYSLPPSPPFPE